MKQDAASPAPVLSIRGVEFGPPLRHKLDLDLRASGSSAILLPHDELALLDAMLSGEPVPLSGEVRICGLNPADDGVWSERLSGVVGKTFSPLFGDACWLENLDVDENIMVAPLMRGEDPAAVRERAQALARRFGLRVLPETRRAATPVEVLTICQWVRAFLVERAALFLMVDPLRNAPTDALDALARECRSWREKGAAFLWLLPKGCAKHARLLGADEVIEFEDAELPTTTANP